MKNLKIYLAILISLVFLLNACEKEDDVNRNNNNCDEWYEGDPCVRMTQKFEGEYTGGAGFCGTQYDFLVYASDTQTNQLLIDIISEGFGVTNTLTIKTELVSTDSLNIPPQGPPQGGINSGYGTLRGDTLIFTYEGDQWPCTYTAVLK